MSANRCTVHRVAVFALLLALSALLASCSTHREENANESVPDASASPGPERDDSAHEVAAAIETALAPVPAIAGRFAPNKDGFAKSNDGVTSPGWRAAWIERARHVGARLPKSADLAFEAGVGVSELYRLSLQPIDAASVPLALDEGRAVYRNAFPSTDVTFAASPERIEWAYTLRDATAPHEFKLRVKLPKNLPTAKMSLAGALEFADADGNGFLRIPRPLVVDAAGTTRDATLSWDGAILSVRFDPTGLTYPIVLDPAIETFVWQVRVQPPYARQMHMMTFDSVRNRTIVFGGYDGSSVLYGDTWEWDGLVWSLRASSGPPGRLRAAMTFDSGRGVTVLFGGSSFGPYFNDTWEWDGTAWTKKCISACTPPSQRYATAMAFHASTGKSVLFGGRDAAGTVLGETWTWDGANWANTGATGVTARMAPVMTYDSSASRVLLFGGQGTAGGAPYYNDLYAWNGAGWSVITAAGGPPSARSQSSFVFQSSSGKALLFGGSGGGPALADTWSFVSASNTWVLGSTGPSARYLHGAAYDSSRKVVVMFGGVYAGTYGDTWEWNSTTETWAVGSGQVPGRLSAAGVYDSYRNRTVVFGGQSSGAMVNDLWEYTGLSWSQACTTAACISSSPTGRSSTAYAYDSSRRRFFVFGGSVSGVTGAETWEFDGDAWGQKCTTLPCSGTKPTARQQATAAFDSVRNRIVMYGGTQGGGVNFAETWEWDGANWAPTCGACTSGSTKPEARYGSAMAFDPIKNRIVLFGGTDAARYGDTWEYNAAAGSWAKVSSSGPTPRANASMVYDAVRKKIVLFGGTTLIGGVTNWVGDTWEWDGTTNTWTSTVATAAGPGARYGEVMVYDSARRRSVMFGGNSGGTFGDTWEYYSRGSGCAVGTDCATGYCVDGVCCEQIACSTCQACNLATSPGVCASVINADDSDSCPSAIRTCDAAGACKLKQAQACSLPTDCAGGTCANGYCCNAPCAGGCDVCNATAGTCTVLAKGAPGVAPSCGAYLCDGLLGDCPSACTADTDCAASYYCDSTGTCQLRRAAGGSCNTASGGDCKIAGCRECGGALACKDGYCCASGCSGSCQTCAATPGTCTSVTSADDPDTCSGTSSCSATGACLAKKGQACTLSSQCATGNCVDGFCCDTACSGSCDVCSATPGTCTVVAQGGAGSPSCGAYVCNGSTASCPTSCGNDADCSSGSYCGAGGTCQARKGAGATCNQAAGADCKSAGCRVCSSSNCIDGYCCDTACGGSCDACNGAALGWAGAANGTCRVAPLSYPGTPACVVYACDGASSTCATTCASDAQCASGYYCSAVGACVAQKAQGATCNLATDCKSGSCRACSTGSCVDGYCCNSACNGQCQACDVGGVAGTCVTVTGSVHVNPLIASRTACPGTGSCGATCNGTSATSCSYPTASTSCGTASCSFSAVTGYSETSTGTCDGGGGCSAATKSCGAYVCGATSCKIGCVGNTDCASGFYCKSGACTGKEPDGTGCTTFGAASCASGNCVDGVCCNVGSCGTGLKCNVVGAAGKCSKPIGVSCASSAECGTGFCVDGVCCDTGCGSQCAACDVSGKVGTCSAVSGAPHGSRSSCGGAGAGTECGQVCNGSDLSACHYPIGSTSCGANTCVTSAVGTGTETHTSVCDGKGACSDTPKTCGGFICDATSCKSSCTTNADCSAGNYCKSGACIPIEGLGTPCTTASTCTSGFCTDGVCCGVGSCGATASCSAGKKGYCASLNGSTCATGSECASGVCTDGVCCDSACDGSCEACNSAGSMGKCVPIVGNPLTGHPPCAGSTDDADCGQRCDGTDGKACKYPGSTASCGKPSCGGGAEKEVSTCDGGGTCKPASRTCAPYVCDVTACLASCIKNDDCAPGNYCKSGSCVKVEGAGKACGSSAECAPIDPATSGFCTDGVCCSVSSCGSGSSCAAADSTTPGSCLKKKGVTCTRADECATGHCVDGTCCDLACGGQCEACDVKGSEGTCTPVVGKPHTPRSTCDSKADNDCAKAQCDGKARDKCNGFVNAGTVSCGVDSCTTDKRFQKKGTCDGAGGCARPDPKPCTPYVCDATAPSGCKTACVTDADCAESFKCDAGVCVQGAHCSDDQLSSIDKSGTSKLCTPYLCNSDGKCATSCGSSADCVAGSVCDEDVKACIVVQNGAADETSGGCGCETGPGDTSHPKTFAGMLAALFALAAVRKRPRRGRTPRA